MMRRKFATGKTVALQTLAETFSDMGVPVFAADMKGDLSGVAKRQISYQLGRSITRGIFGGLFNMK